MGEKKRREEAETPQDRVARMVGKQLANEGLILEAGWAIHRSYFMPADLPKDQEMAYRNAFFAGAEHFYHTIMGALDSGHDVTDGDMRRMALADAEVKKWRAEMVAMGLVKPVPGVKN